MRVHYAEADNELHHLLIMESLGGADEFADRFIAQHLAFFYFWFVVSVYLISPRTAYHLSELIEMHAYNSYDAFLAESEAELRAKPVPAVAREYYEAEDGDPFYVTVLDAAPRGGPGADGPRPRLDSLYDVFTCVRDDELSHWQTLSVLRRFESLELPCGCEVEDADIGPFARRYIRQVQPTDGAADASELTSE